MNITLIVAVIVAVTATFIVTAIIAVIITVNASVIIFMSITVKVAIEYSCVGWSLWVGVRG